MSHAATSALAGAEAPPGPHGKRRVSSTGSDPTALASIYDEETNIAIWQRALPPGLQASAAAVLASGRSVEIGRQVTPQSAEACLNEALGVVGAERLSHDVAMLVDMFCCLFEREYAGLRLTALTRAMCPRFHVDNVPCRLVTTYQGPATDWLPHACVDRRRLGPGSEGWPDAESGLYSGPDDIQHLGSGDVALLKGERWEGNERAGLVHRSPAVRDNEARLLLTLDLIDR